MEVLLFFCFFALDHVMVRLAYCKFGFYIFSKNEPCILLKQMYSAYSRKLERGIVEGQLHHAFMLHSIQPLSIWKAHFKLNKIKLRLKAN